jgi:hypothetical protein
MTYSVGGLIEASDYNLFNGGSSGVSVSGQLNSVWGIGNGTNGYGQTTGANVSVGNNVTASQWATLINNLNNARKHQAGGGYTNLTAPVTGNRVDYISTLSSRLTDAYTNRLSFTGSGTTITGSNDTITWGQVLDNQEFNTSRTATITFGSSDQARYFFNAGGALSFFCSATNISGTSRSNALQACIGIAPSSGLQYISTFGANDNLGPLNYTSRNLNRGYYQAEFGNYLELATFYNTAPYGTTYAQIAYDAGSSDTTRGSKGNIIRFRLYMYAPTDPGGGTIEISTTLRVDILPPSTTYLSNSWGTPSITWGTP